MAEFVVDELCRFLDESKKILDGVVAHREVLFPKDFSGTISDAWHKEVDNTFEDIKNRLKNEYDKIKKILEKVGLIGKQLELKLKGFYRALKKWAYRYGSDVIDLLIFLFQWMLLILGSLAEATIEAEAIKELIESMDLLLSEGS